MYICVILKHRDVKFGMHVVKTLFYFMKPAEFTYYIYFLIIQTFEASGFSFIQVRARPLFLIYGCHFETLKRTRSTQQKRQTLQTTTMTTQVLEVFTVYLTTQVIIHKEGPTFSFNGLFCCVLLVFFKVPLAARVRFHATITICDDGIIQLGLKTGLTPVIVHIVHLSIRTIFLFPLKVLIWKHTLKMY